MLRTVPAASPKAMLLSLEIVLIVGASVVSTAGAMLSFRDGLERAVLPGSKNKMNQTGTFLNVLFTRTRGQRNALARRETFSKSLSPAPPPHVESMLQKATKCNLSKITLGPPAPREACGAAVAWI
jgi:hypothetical protein